MWICCLALELCRPMLVRPGIWRVVGRRSSWSEVDTMVESGLVGLEERAASDSIIFYVQFSVHVNKFGAFATMIVGAIF